MVEEEILNKIQKAFETYKNEISRIFESTFNEKSKPENKDKESLKKLSKLKNGLIGPAFLSLKIHLVDLASLCSKLDWDPLTAKYKDYLAEIDRLEEKMEIQECCYMSNFWEVDLTKGTDDIFITQRGSILKDMPIYGFWTNGKEVYQGRFTYLRLDQAPLRNGPGMQIFLDGSSFEGKFKDGELSTGKWILESKEEFFGRVKKGKDGIEWMIGLKKSDLKEKHDAVKNYLYYKGEKTILGNLNSSHDVDIRGLKGEESYRTQIFWSTGVE